MSIDTNLLALISQRHTETTIQLTRIHEELVAIRKAVQTKSGRPHLITVKALAKIAGWDPTKIYDHIIDANRITAISPFDFWGGPETGNFRGAFIELGKQDGVHVAMTPDEVKALADA